MARTLGAALAFALLVAGMAGAGLVSAESDVDDHVTLEIGETKDWGGGEYVALNMTRNETFALFGVLYGTEEFPNHIILISTYAQFLGGAELRDRSGGTMGIVPIPVLTVHAQALGFLVEFRDTGVPTLGGEMRGAGNGLFDFERTGTGIDDIDLTATEPIYKAIDLKTAWERSEVTEVERNDHRKAWEFSLTARNLPYTRVWDGDTGAEGRPGAEADGALETASFIFHIGVDVTTENVQVPWYRVTLGPGGEVLASEEAGQKLYRGVGLEASFKYDHVLEGWDFTAQDADSRLMLETFVAFGSFVPDLVQRWIDVEFGAGYSDTLQVAEIETFTGGPQEIANVDDIPDDATLLTKDAVTFRDPWRKNGEVSWVNDVEVDGRRDQMRFQIHAGEADFDARDENQDGTFHGAVLIGGYIYPAGASLFHDPAFLVSAVIVEIPASVSLPLALLAVAVIVWIIILLTALGYAARAGRRNETTVSPNFRLR